MVVSLWSGPRNCSTALMYSFAQRPDTQVFDEPLFAHFLKKTGVSRPSREEVLATMPSELDKIQENWKDAKKPCVFLKHMANHLEGLDPSMFQEHRHVILTREPRKVLRSYMAHIQVPTPLDLCYQHQLKWLNYCEVNQWPVVVLDSDALVANPELSLLRLCEWLELPFSTGMLHWTPGPRIEDGVWAKYWYQSVHRSAGWEPPNKLAIDDGDTDDLSKFSSLLQEITPTFNQLKNRSII